MDTISIKMAASHIQYGEQGASKRIRGNSSGSHIGVLVSQSGSSISIQHLLMRFWVLKKELSISTDSVDVGTAVANITGVYCTKNEGENRSLHRASFQWFGHLRTVHAGMFWCCGILMTVGVGHGKKGDDARLLVNGSLVTVNQSHS